MKGMGFKHLKRKEGLQFYLKGFNKSRTCISEKSDLIDEVSDLNESTEDLDL
jgi:hypothetical protein